MSGVARDDLTQVLLSQASGGRRRSADAPPARLRAPAAAPPHRAALQHTVGHRLVPTGPDGADTRAARAAAARSGPGAAAALTPCAENCRDLNGSLRTNTRLTNFSSQKAIQNRSARQRRRAWTIYHGAWLPHGVEGGSWRQHSSQVLWPAPKHREACDSYGLLHRCHVSLGTHPNVRSDTAVPRSLLFTTRW